MGIGDELTAGTLAALSAAERAQLLALLAARGTACWP